MEAEDEDESDLFGNGPQSAIPPAVPQEGPEAHSDDEWRCEPCGPRRSLPDPGQPTASEIEEHRLDHLPYRSWCAECVAARGTGEQHRTREEDTRTVSVFSFDFLFITENRIVPREALLKDEVIMKILVARDSLSRAVFAHAVSSKSPEDGYAVERLLEDVKWLGHEDPASLGQRACDPGAAEACLVYLAREGRRARAGRGGASSIL